jgi:hypothetical protein
MAPTPSSAITCMMIWAPVIFAPALGWVATACSAAWVMPEA